MSSFHRLGAEDSGKTFAVLAADPSKRGSIEFDTYARLVATQLSAQGFREVGLQPEPDLLVFLEYGIDAGQTVSGSLPVYGQTGGGYTYQGGSVTAYGPGGSAAGTYSGYTYSPPTYGVVGAVPYSRTDYRRVLFLDIVDAKRSTPRSVVKVYEARVLSIGRTPSLPQIVPLMIQSLFSDFPGASGATRTVTLPLP